MGDLSLVAPPRQGYKMLLEHSQLSTTEIYGQFRPGHLGNSDDQHPWCGCRLGRSKLKLDDSRHVLPGVSSAEERNNYAKIETSRRCVGFHIDGSECKRAIRNRRQAECRRSVWSEQLARVNRKGECPIRGLGPAGAKRASSIGRDRAAR